MFPLWQFLISLLLKGKPCCRHYFFFRFPSDLLLLATQFPVCREPAAGSISFLFSLVFFFFYSKYSECCLHNNNSRYVVFIKYPSPGNLNVIYMHKFVKSFHFSMMWWISLFFFCVSEREVNRQDSIWDYHYLEAGDNVQYDRFLGNNISMLKI